MTLNLSETLLYGFGHPCNVVPLGIYPTLEALIPFLLLEVKLTWLIISHMTFLVRCLKRVNLTFSL